MKIAKTVKSEFQRIVTAFQSWSQDGGNLMAAAVAYYAGLSFFPLILVLVSSLGYFLEWTESGVSARQEIVAAVESQFSASLADQVSKVLDTVGTEAPTNSLAGWLGLLLSAGVLFLQFDAAFDRIWGQTDSTKSGWLQVVLGFLRQRLTSFVMLTVLGGFVVAVSVASFVLTETQRWLPLPDVFWTVLAATIPIVVNLVAFTLLYRFVPSVKVHWREAFRGAVFATVMWEIGRLVLTVFVLDGSYGSTYQIVGSFIAVLLWIYYAAATVFLGAEYIRSFCAECDESHDAEQQASTMSELKVGTRVHDRVDESESRSSVAARD